MPQLRQSIITGDWVVIAPERAKRPNDFIVKRKVKLESINECVFELDSTAYQQRIEGFETENIYLINNKYPAFLSNSKDCSARSYEVEDFYTARPSVGGHDVVVVKDHELGLNNFSEQIWLELFEITRRRVDYFQNVCNVASAVPIYNHRQKAGASIYHPHAQIFAANVIPNLISRELHHTEYYFEQNGSCAFCDMVQHELKANTRIVAKNETFAAFAVYAARLPFEMWILPKNHQSNYEKIKTDDLKDLASIMKAVMTKLDKLLDNPPLNYFIHTLPKTYKGSSYYHWHIEIMPRLQDLGGFELGAEMNIDVMSPEKAAEHLNA